MLEDIEKQIQETIDELEIKAKSGDTDSQYDLFVLLNAKAMQEYDDTIFQRAEKFLILSANRGHKDAKKALEDHEIRKYAFKRRVQRHKEKK